jgi:phosphopantetheine--protein transferase-like protein
MGSVAGRFGNAGQVDYSAANEALAQIAAIRPGTIHVDWTAWGDVGMAVRGGMKTLLESRGVEMLPADAGAGLCVDLVAQGAEGEVVVSGRLGGFLPTAGHPLLDRVDFRGEAWVGERLLSVEKDAWILDHAIDDVPVLPGVIGIEWMAAVSARIHPGLPFAGLQELTFHSPVKLHRNEPVHIEVEALPIGDDTVRCTLYSERTLKTGRVLRTLHFEGTVLLGSAPVLPGLPRETFGDYALDADAIYRRFFHGPGFQVLTGVSAVGDRGLLASGQLNHKAIGTGLESAPLVLEAAFQAAGLHAMVSDGVLALPAGIEGLSQGRALVEDNPFELEVHRRGDLYDVDVVQDKQRILSLRGFRMAEKGPLPEGDRFDAPLGPDSAEARATTDSATAGILDGTEIAQLEARGNAKRRADRIAGRIAAKKALSALTGAPPSEISIEQGKSGEPLAWIRGQPGPALSITHSEGEAVALAVARGRVGVDMETVVARHPAFAREWFRPEEIARLGEGADALTLAWSVKEAVLKALGTGMALNPREIEVQRVEEDRVSLSLHGEAARVHADLGGGDWQVRFRREAGRILVSARLAA